MGGSYNPVKMIQRDKCIAIRRGRLCVRWMIMIKIQISVAFPAQPPPVIIKGNFNQLSYSSIIEFVKLKSWLNADKITTESGTVAFYYVSIVQ